MLDYFHYRGIDMNRLGGFLWPFYSNLIFAIAAFISGFVITSTKSLPDSAFGRQCIERALEVSKCLGRLVKGRACGR